MNSFVVWFVIACNGVKPMTNKNLLSAVLAAALVVASVAPAFAQSRQRTQDNKNNWRNTAYAAGAVSVLGMIGKNGTLTTLGALGAGYSAYRYEQERKKQNQRYGSTSYRNRQAHLRKLEEERRHNKKKWKKNGHDNGRHLGWTKGKHKGWDKKAKTWHNDD